MRHPPSLHDRLVVEAHVAAHDRHAERLARRGDAVDRARERVHHLGPLGVAEVEAVGDADGLRARAHEVAAHLGDRHRGPDERVELAHPAVAVDGEGEKLLEIAVVAARDTRTTAASDPGRTTVPPRTIWSYCRQTQAREPTFGEPTSSSSSRPRSLGIGIEPRIDRRHGELRRRSRPVVDGRAVGQDADGDVADDDRRALGRRRCQRIVAGGGLDDPALRCRSPCR